MILLLHGPDTYRSRRKLKEIIDEYRAKAGTDLNMYRIDAEEGEIQHLKGVLETGSLFQNKKLVVVENLCASGNIEYLGAANDSDVVVLWERGLSKKQLDEIQPRTTKMQEFKMLAGEPLRAFLQDEIKKRDLSLQSEHKIKLAALGGDTWAIVQYLDKVAVSSNRASLQSVAPALGASTVFNLGDTFFTAPAQAMRHIFALIDQGEDEFGVFAYCAGHTRTLHLIKHTLSQKQPLAGIQGIHPFVIKKISSIAQKFSLAQCRISLQNFFEEDYKIKIGLSRPRDSLFSLLTRQQIK